VYIDVLIPAYNAQGSIGRAVASALAQPEVASVIVVDDCSSDATAAAAEAAGAGDNRLRIERFFQNRGPAAARNHALSLGQAPFVTMLDADDWLLSGRFRTLLAVDDWDLIADNILFRPEELENAALPVARLAAFPDRKKVLGLAEFVERNISRPGRSRSELGFLKPVMRRTMLERLGLRYAEDVRLGEDFVLYAKAMAGGAKFRLSLQCGYVAIEHAGSLSGRHSVEDLATLVVASREIATFPSCTRAERLVLERHRASIERKVRHRRLLAAKRDAGIAKAVLSLASNPMGLIQTGIDIIRDKRRTSDASHIGSDRFLMSEIEFPS
jgi:succinoglycan biosynthesis protein ExoU